MLTRLLSWPRRRSAPPRQNRRAVLGVECLEERAVPAGGGTAPPSGPPTAIVSPINPNLPPAAAGAKYSQTFTARPGGTPYMFSETGALPSGLTLSAGGTLSGTPAAGDVGSFTFTVTATPTVPAKA
ncbi:MAG TPA: Ig domain-containing protein, partial [Gemmataceae bacterium]|nr:Ig domain-containing protein [Gemmataceae bacterium]